MIDRRSFTAAAGASMLLSALGLSPSTAEAAARSLKLAPREPFSFPGLVARAKAMAAQPYKVDTSLPGKVLDRLTYEALGQVKYDTEAALFRDGPGNFPVTFFHLGQYSRTPVQMHVLEVEGSGTEKGQLFSREILYDPSYFTMPADSPAKDLPKGAGFAGFRFQESRKGDQKKLPWTNNDWVAFQGASYFRAIGDEFQYGLSARGILVDAALPDHPEEFPNFTHFYFDPPADGGDTVVVHALLDGPSVTGAFKFIIQRAKAVVMDVDATIFYRKDIARLGVAALTSMFWFSETTKQTATDWRPEVHDSDGLALWTGSGERLWRPLLNPNVVQASAFADAHPRGFGLQQRDRSFDHYLDGVFYDRRPSLWVEPVGDWGEGSVQLIEIPTSDEIMDNTVACWVPKAPAKAGGSLSLKYRLHWMAGDPTPFALARCVATRLGRGGQPGHPRPKGVTKFIVEFQGDPLKKIPFGAAPEAMLSAASGKFSYIFCEAVPDSVPGHWRAQFDFTPANAQPVDMRLYLRFQGQPLSETWLYHLVPV